MSLRIDVEIVDGVVTLPREVIDALDLQPGSLIEVDLDPNGRREAT